MNAADAFCVLLRKRLRAEAARISDLALNGPAYRADPLFEAGADLAEMVVAYQNGTVGESVVREEALKTAALACQVYLATVRRRPAGEEHDGGDC